MCLWADDVGFAVPLVSAEFASATAVQLCVDQSNERRISSTFTIKCAVSFTGAHMFWLPLTWSRCAALALV